MQKQTDYLIGIDLGTTAIKGVAMALSGEIISSEKAANSYIRREGGFIEFSAADFYTNVAGIISKLACSIPEGTRIAGISIASASGNTLLADEDGNPLADAISWMDTRVTDEITRVFGSLDPSKVYDLIGWPLIDMFPLAHLSWLKCHEPGLLEKAHTVCMTTDYINYRLTGKWGIDPSTATTFYLQDQVSRKWHRPFLDALGISEEKLPPIYKSGSILGYITKDASESTGLPEGTPVILGAFDHPCAARGSGVFREGQAMISCGTSWVVFYPVDDREKAIKLGMLADPFLSGEIHDISGTWGAMFSIPDISSHVDNLICRFISPAPGRYEEFDRLAENALPGAGGLSLNPMDDKNLPYDVIEKHSKSDIARAIMEGAAYLLKENMDVLRDSGLIADSLVMVGGPSETHPWPQIISEILGIEITSANGAFAGAAGAARLAGIGAGKY
ncbi:MAG: xylulokinase [Saccharofermentanales bacterium]